MLEHATVRELLHEGGKEWSKELILDTFWKEEADIILHMPVSKCGREDTMI